MKKKINNKELIDILYKTKNVKMGKHVSYMYQKNPKQLVFTLARYKFVSKILDGFNNVMEIGAGDGFQSSIVAQTVKQLTLCDIDTRNKLDFKKNTFFKNSKYIIHDFSEKKFKSKFNAMFCLDVLEHISKKKEDRFIKNIKLSLVKNGTLIIGTPSIESQKYASKTSKLAHVNCKSKANLKKLLKKHFNVVYMFSMNDEIVHTGYDPMSNYNFAVCN